MNWRVITFAAIGLAAVPFAYRGFHAVFERLMMPGDWPPPYVDSSGFHDREGMAPLVPYNRPHIPGKAVIEVVNGMEDPNEEALQIEVVKDQAFVLNRLLAPDEITAYVNETHVMFVIVTPIRGSTWNSVFPILDACRKSKVRVVFLNTTQPI